MKNVLAWRGLVRRLCLTLTLVLLHAPDANAQARLRKQMDFDNDNKADFAVFRPSSNTWYILKSGGGNIGQPFGVNSTDFQTPGDFDGDGKADICVWRE